LTREATNESITHTLVVARAGVLQGDAANANVRPARYACTPDNTSRKEEIY
jgi:hypothetical protein